MEKKMSLEGATFPNVTFINMEESDVTFDKAEEAAKRVARTYDSAPLLLSWYDKKAGKTSPDKSCEGQEPGWIEYAKSHGGCFTVSVNHGEYMFIFKCEHDFK